MSAAESHSLREPTDRAALLDFSTVFERQEPLATGELDDFLDPNELRLHLDDGIGDADTARFDVVWTTTDDYNVQYADSLGRNTRWDVHQHSYPQPTGEGHFHPPPDASSDPTDVAASCITASEIELVARAVHARWRHAYDRGSLDGINDASNPP